MRRLTVIIFILFAVSCSRTNQPTPQPNPDPGSTPGQQPSVTQALPLLDSVYFYSLGAREITFSKQKMVYDGSGRLTDIRGTSTDTALDGTILRPDTTDFALIYKGSDSLPSGYNDHNVSPVPFTTYGSLSYDDKGRIVQDSNTNSVKSWINRYQYSEGKITRNGTDSIIIANNNVQLIQGSLSIYSYTYSSYPNPFYQPGLAQHIAPFMIFNYIDIFSKNLYSSSTARYANSDPYQVINYSWKTNANNQVISGIGTDAKTGAIIQYIWFTYR